MVIVWAPQVQPLLALLKKEGTIVSTRLCTESAVLNDQNKVNMASMKTVTAAVLHVG